jgi:hypothetical protein
MLITSHTSYVSRARATAMFRGPLRELKYGRLRIVIDFYLPYYLFLVRTENRRKVVDSLYGIDAISGILDPYQFDEPLTAVNRREVETSCSLPLQIGPQEAFRTLEERMRRLIFMESLFKVRAWKMSGELVESFYMPFWVGIYERGDRAHLEVIDAVRGRFEGAKVREIVAGWFRTVGSAQSAVGSSQP